MSKSVFLATSMMISVEVSFSVARAFFIRSLDLFLLDSINIMVFGAFLSCFFARTAAFEVQRPVALLLLKRCKPSATGLKLLHPLGKCFCCEVVTGRFVISCFVKGQHEC